MVEGPDGLLIEVFSFDQETTPDHLRPYFDLSTSHGRGDDRVSLGPFPTGPSAAVAARLDRAPTEPLRPPPANDLDAVAQWRQSVHQAWLDGDPSAEACGHNDERVAGVRCLRAGRQHSDAPLVIYCHGGGFALGSPEVALPITQRLASEVEVLSLDYRLAPEHPYPAALQDVLAVASEVGRSGRPYVLAGDSAGATLALSAAMAGPVVPVGLVLLSPHLAFQSDGFQERSRDRSSDVDEVTARWLNDAYRGARPAESPELSPLRAENDQLCRLPPTLIQVAALESGLSGAARLAKRLESLGVDVTLDVWPDLWHTWHYHRDLPEADRALTEAARFASRSPGGAMA